MIRSYKIEGIVLKRTNFGEADRLVTVFTREKGKLRAIAKGIRRVPSRRAGHLEVFNRAILFLHKGKQLDIITEVRSRERTIRMQMDVQRVSYCYYLCELVDKLLPEHQEHRDVYVLLDRALETIDAAGSEAEYEQCVTEFALELLWTLGFLPRSQTLNALRLNRYIEQLTERTMKTAALLTKLHRHG